jgi:hypothetical protein
VGKITKPKMKTLLFILLNGCWTLTTFCIVKGTPSTDVICNTPYSDKSTQINKIKEGGTE